MHGIIKKYVKAYGYIPVVCLGGLLRHDARFFDNPSGLYRSGPENYRRFAEHLGVDCVEVREVIAGGDASDDLLLALGLERAELIDVCHICGHESRATVYRIFGSSTE